MYVCVLYNKRNFAFHVKSFVDWKFFSKKKFGLQNFDKKKRRCSRGFLKTLNFIYREQRVKRPRKRYIKVEA